MDKYFVVSDIHGFYDELRLALDRADFCPENPDHILVVCGDIFDRGSQPLEVYDFLREIPEERRVLIRGNHEDLLADLAKRGYAMSHDDSNGTYDTLAYIAKQPTRREFILDTWQRLGEGEPAGEAYQKIEAASKKREKKLFGGHKLKEILRWIDEEFVDYYETDGFVFVHSFIPTLRNEKQAYFGHVDNEEYDPDWRIADQEAWKAARWGCPWKKLPLNKTGKTIVCGHWHASDFWNNLVYHDAVLNTYSDNPIFYQQGIPLIGIDACTAATGGVNVLTIEGDKIECFNHNERWK